MFQLSTDRILQCTAHRLCGVLPDGILNLRYCRCKSEFRLLHLLECRHSGSWASTGIFRECVCGNTVPFCPAPSASQITPRQSSPPGSLINPFAAQLACRGEISEMPFDECSAAMCYLRFCFVVLIEAIRVILISRQRVSNRSYSAEERIFVFPNSSNQ